MPSSGAVIFSAKVIGWNYTTINYKSTDPTTLISAMSQALQQHPFAVGFSGVPEAVWASQIPAYDKAGVKIIPVVTGPLSSSSPAVTTGIGDFTNAGKSLGDVWRHSSAGLIPFHKLSQWLTYSLFEPLEAAGLVIDAQDELTGLVFRLGLLHNRLWAGAKRSLLRWLFDHHSKSRGVWPQ